MKYLCFEQTLPITIEEAWNFFSSPKNLNLITPPDVKFKILNDVPEQITAGTMIYYQISPFLNLKFKWVTEISVVSHHNHFFDEQRKGPYRIWHHEHYFTKTDSGVLMTDKVFYDIGKSVFGWMAGKLVVDKKVKNIFAFRRKKLEELFSTK